jgi:hypothetical protein
MFLHRSIVVCSFILIAAAAAAEQKPTRSECIIGFRLDWSQVKDELASNNAMGSPTGDKRIEALAGMMKSLDGERLYLQFRSDCDRKLEMALRVIDLWRSEGIDLPKFERILDPIMPSTRTIDLRGPAWRDDYPGVVDPLELEGDPYRNEEL